jgi:hypothetical protein
MSVLLLRGAVLLRLVTTLAGIVVLIVITALLVHSLLTNPVGVVRLARTATFPLRLPSGLARRVSAAVLGPILRIAALFKLANLMLVSLVSRHVFTSSSAGVGSVRSHLTSGHPDSSEQRGEAEMVRPLCVVMQAVELSVVEEPLVPFSKAPAGASSRGD